MNVGDTKWLLKGALVLSGVVVAAASQASSIPAATEFRKDIQPILSEFCYDCHGDGAKKGGVAFDEFKSDEALVENRELWWNALKYLRAGVMPPEKKPRPSGEQLARIERWIKFSVFKIDPSNPDPGAVTVRRLNRVEYRNTIRDLIGVDFNTDVEFPADDTGHGFDNIGDVLTLSPMLLEKYLAAAKTIVEKATSSRPDKYTAFFTKEKAPEDLAERRAYAGQVLGNFARKAFRRPADQRTITRLVTLAEDSYQHSGKKFEEGVGQAAADRDELVGREVDRQHRPVRRTRSDRHALR